MAIQIMLAHLQLTKHFQSRAKAVVSALIAKGIDKSRLTAKGWGQEKSVADNATEDGRAKNRRVEIVKLNKKFSKNNITIPV